MKIAPFMEAFRPYQDAHEIRLVHMGRHYDAKMSDDFFRDLGIAEPEVKLGVGSASHAEQTARVMVAFEQVCLRETPDWVVVGDINSTMACAVTAKKRGIRVAHVEAGLRSRDMTMPEEINRLCTDAISALRFTTDEMKNQNLRREGVAKLKIRFVSNAMIDTLFRHNERAQSFPLPDGLGGSKFAVLTLHRPGNVDSRERRLARLPSGCRWSFRRSLDGAESAR